MSQLKAYIEANGPGIAVKGKTFEVENLKDDGDIAMATFKSTRASYTGIRCNNTRVIGAQGAEVWSILGGKREIASFAIHNGAIKTLGR